MSNKHAVGDYVSRRGDPSCEVYTITDISASDSNFSLLSEHGDTISVSREVLMSGFTGPARLVFADDRPGAPSPEMVKLSFTRYRNNNALAITFATVDIGEAYMTASLNRPEFQLGANQVFLKDYAENAGVADLLIRNGIINPTPLPSGAYELTAMASLIALLQQSGDLPAARPRPRQRVGA